MASIGQAQFEREVLFSLMRDSVNLLVRMELRPRGFPTVDSPGNDWTDRAIMDYLPKLAQAVPLKAACVVPASQGDELDTWLMLPHALVSDALRAFLVWFLETAIELGKVDPDAREAVRQSLPEVGDRVAKAWQRTGF